MTFSVEAEASKRLIAAPMVQKRAVVAQEPVEAPTARLAAPARAQFQARPALVAPLVQERARPQAAQHQFLLLARVQGQAVLQQEVPAMLPQETAPELAVEQMSNRQAEAHFPHQS